MGQYCRQEPRYLSHFDDDTLGLPVVVGADAMEPRSRRVAAAALLVVAWFGVLAPLHKAQSPAALDAVGAKPNNAAPPGEDAGGDADALATATATIPDADALMPLYATVAVKFGSDFVGSTLSVSVEYKPRKGSSLPSLWTAPETFVVDGMSATYSVDLFRLRAAQDYVYRVFAAAEGAAATEVAGGYFTAQSTGWHRFDSGAYAAVSGDAPSFEVGAFAVYPSYTAHEQAKQWFQGLVAVDAEGWVVWMYSLCMLEAWDFLPDHTIALIARSDGSCSELTDHGKGTSAKSFKGEDGSLYEANSQLHAFGRMSMAGRVCPLTNKTAPASPSICQSSSLKSSWMSRTSARSRYWNMTTASSMAATCVEINQ